MNPVEYFRAKAGHAFGLDGRPVLFYPGSGSDSGPIDLMHEVSDEGGLSIYVDYNLNFDQVHALISKTQRAYGSGTPVVTELFPSDFGMARIKSFYPTRKDCTAEEWELFQFQMAHPQGGDWLGQRAFFPDRNFALICLKAEAVQSLKILLRNKIFPDIIVLEDANFGGEWTGFGGNSKLYEASKHKPKFIYVSENTQAWPGYKRVTESRVDEASCHR